MRLAVVLAALVAIVIGIIGLVSPDTLTAIWQQYISTSAGSTRPL
jgi:hypothetical protein